MEKVCDVVIIGAGVSGLTSAYRIQQKNPDLRIVVLEANDRIGGRTKTISLKSSKGTDKWDIGGQWIGRTQTHAWNLIKELGLTLYPQNVNGKKISQVASKNIRTYSSDLPTYNNPLATVDFVRLIFSLNNVTKRCSITDPFSFNDSERMDGLTMAEYAKQHCWTEENRENVEIVSRILFGAAGSELSALFFAVFANSGGEFLNLLGASDDGAQAYKVSNGMQQISQILADKIQRDDAKGEVILNEAVDEILDYAEDDMVQLKTKSGRTFSCRFVIAAIPPSEIARITFRPLLPSTKRRLVNHFPMGHYIKFVVTYDRAFWKENGFSGEVAVTGYSQNDSERQIRPVLVTFDATNDKDCPAIVGFMNFEWGNKPAEERREAVMEDLVTYFGTEASSYLDYVDKDWSEEPYIGGCPTSVVAPGFMKEFVEAVRLPIGRIHWAGTETATQWTGYISGAVQAGERAATEVLYRLSPDSMETEDLIATAYHPKYRKPTIPEKRTPRSNLHWYALLAAGFVTVSLLLHRHH